MDERDIVQRLDLILKVLALQVASDRSVTERVRLLKLAGIDNRTIAEVLNTTPNTVRVLGQTARKPRTTKGKSSKKKTSRKESKN